MKYTNKYNVPRSIYDAISTDTYDGPVNDQNSISATGLIDPPLIRQLKIRNWDNISEDVSDNIWMLLGTSVHAMLERVSGTNRIKEKRINVDLDGMAVSGQPDIYELDTKTIQDYKITSAWTVVYNDNGKDEWEQQLNIYAWLFRNEGYVVDKLQIVCILRDWSKMKSSEDSYPSSPIHVLEIPLWSQDKQLEYITERIKKHKESSSLNIKDIPTCSRKERWAEDDKYAVMKKGNKKATKLCTSMDEATKYMENHRDAKTMSIVKRVGGDRRCNDYCTVNKWCPYYKEVSNGVTR